MRERLSKCGMARYQVLVGLLACLVLNANAGVIPRGPEVNPQNNGISEAAADGDELDNATDTGLSGGITLQNDDEETAAGSRNGEISLGQLQNVGFSKEASKTGGESLDGSRSDDILEGTSNTDGIDDGTSGGKLLDEPDNIGGASEEPRDREVYLGYLNDVGSASESPQTAKTTMSPEDARKSWGWIWGEEPWGGGYPFRGYGRW